ncbi:hypothetical protein AWC05_28365 [Mycobacterium florentinum]|uniref:Low molecular weight antigen MTB12-like C-terminal domain-containing protein n=1 Tax=Mycobacterium florentinum TaxID=292462 RepID=A0A1X1U261_MYCFL|nr:hypothetical protein [Mycobacterium florentinum]ORV50925.1 hypothetical protein AWC05_28365 [Mycobacterium florentinum]BBX78636.1 hypothetical protein MFLOJ_24230 [Mycobacterium florentinum]
MIVAAIAVVAVLAVAGVFGYKYFIAGKSDEEQITALVATFATDFNNADGAGIDSLICGGKTKLSGVGGAFAAAYTSDGLRGILDENGAVSMSVANIRVNGNHATAQVTSTWSKSPTSPSTESSSFAKENGNWTICDASS